MANPNCVRAWGGSDASPINHMPTGFACGNSTSAFQQCCMKGDYCMSDGFCHYTHSQEEGSQYYNAGCTDPTFQDPSCPQNCRHLRYPDVVYNSTANNWRCCLFNSAQGGPDCTLEGGSSWVAPAPNNLQTLAQVGKLDALVPATSSMAAPSSSTNIPATATSSTSSSNSPSSSAASTISSSSPKSTTALSDAPSTTASSNIPSTTTDGDGATILIYTAASAAETSTEIKGTPQPTMNQAASAQNMPSNNRTGLDAGAAAGIGIGVVAALILIVLVAFWIWYRRSRRPRTEFGKLENNSTTGQNSISRSPISQRDVSPQSSASPFSYQHTEAEIGSQRTPQMAQMPVQHPAPVAIGVSSRDRRPQPAFQFPGNQHRIGLSLHELPSDSGPRAEMSTDFNEKAKRQRPWQVQ